MAATSWEAAGAAGHPSRGRPSAAVVGGVAASAVLHLIGGWYLYNQRFVLDDPTVDPPKDPPPFVIDMRPPPPPPPKPAPEPPKPVVKVHDPVEQPFKPPIPPAPFPPQPDAPLTDGITPVLSPVVIPPQQPVADGHDPVVEAPRAPPAPRVIERPAWLTRPSAADMDRHYPRRAITQEVEGDVRLRCTVTAAGAVSGCEVLEESPSAYGFGQAAVRLSAKFRMKPRTEDGRPVEGALVEVPLKFRLS